MAVNAVPQVSKASRGSQLHSRVMDARLSKMMAETRRRIYVCSGLPEWKQRHYLESRPELVMTEHRASAL